MTLQEDHLEQMFNKAKISFRGGVPYLWDLKDNMSEPTTFLRFCLSLSHTHTRFSVHRGAADDTEANVGVTASAEKGSQ